MTIGMDAVTAEPVDDWALCDYVDRSVAGSNYDRDNPLTRGKKVPSYISPHSGRCKNEAVVRVQNGTGIIHACERHARDEWLQFAGVE